MRLVEAINTLKESMVKATRIETVECLRTAIDALEKQIPVKPIGVYTDYKCPICSRRVRSGKGSSSAGKRDNFCQRCGQKLDWSEE